MKKTILLLTTFLLLIAALLHAQTQTVSGEVRDLNGEVIPGANIVVKGTTIGVVTDSDGKYTINVPSDQGFRL